MNFNSEQFFTNAEENEFGMRQIGSEDYHSISVGRYVAGGVVGMMLGLGIGHAVQGRYLRTGWIFTVLYLGGGSVLAYAVLDGHVGLMWGTSLALSVVRVLEIIDVWWLPSSFKVIAQNKLSLSPTILYSKNQNSNPALGLSLNFKW